MQVNAPITDAPPVIPVVPRTLFEVAAFPDPPNGFDPASVNSSIVSTASRLMRFADADGDGSITRSEAGRVAVRDPYTTERWNGSPLRMEYVDATVTYDAAAALFAADETPDGRVTRDELAHFLLTRGGEAGNGSFQFGDATAGRLDAALSGAREVSSVAHGRTYVTIPW